MKQAKDKEQKEEQQSQKMQVHNMVVSAIQTFKFYAFAKIKVHVPFSMGMPKNIKNAIFHPPQKD
ncbi:MAG: hypothetical protein V4594_04145 [Bacteroidota bacterium]